MRKTCLVVIDNHYFPSNVARVENLYGERFPHMIHLLPVNGLQKKNVYSMARSSHHFHGYVHDSAPVLLATDCERFVFIADDLLLNPQINHANVGSFFGLVADDDSYIHSLEPLSTLSGYWMHVWSAIDFNPDQLEVNVSHALPDLDDAQETLRKFGYINSRVPRKSLYRHPLSALYDVASWPARTIDRVARKALRMRKLSAHNPLQRLRYPLLRGYSDVFIVSRHNLPLFSQYCGAFAAAGLFVEIGLPTALALSSQEVRTNNDSLLQAKLLWGKKQSELEEFNQSLSRLREEYLINYLYVHPVKLSQWRADQ